MATTTITFVPEDFDSVISLDMLASHLSEIITELRNNNQPGNKMLNIIKELEKMPNISKESSIKDMFNGYEYIKKASMELRALLSNFINLNTYDNISYAFYFNGKRYSTDTIRTEWLMKGSKGELRLNLEKATKDLEMSYKEGRGSSLQDLFAKHYQSYLNVITGTYNGAIGKKGSRLNRGHIAEGYESHLAEHHGQAYNLLNNFNNISIADQMILTQIEKELEHNWWADHESVTYAWSHIKGALGTQRGTVAGDVGRWQVKQGHSADKKSKYADQVRIASVATIRDGIKLYCDIVNPDIPIKNIAYKLAIYLSEPVNIKEKEVLAKMSNEILANEFNGLAAAIENCGKVRHI